MAINALVEMGNLEKVWALSCLSLPSHLGAVIPGNGVGEERNIARYYCLTGFFRAATELFSKLKFKEKPPLCFAIKANKQP